MTRTVAEPAPPKANTVFVSYSRADEALARPIIEVLERAGFGVWWDGLLGGGERYARSTAAALESAQAVVVLWSKTSIDSHWVHDEAAHGRDQGRLVPLSIDGSQPPLGFRQFQVIDANHPRRDGPEMRQLVEAVTALHAAAPAGRTPRPAARAGFGRRMVLLGGGAALAAAGGVVVWRTGLLGAGAAKANTVAVLPFANISGDPEQGYFVDGLCAEVRAALARNAALSVVGQASSNTFKTRTDDAKVIARKLGVAVLLDGSVRLAPGRVRIAAELIDGATGFSTWSQTFDRALDDIFAVQSEIAAAVTGAITRVVDKTEGTTRTGGTEDVGAFDAYLRGKAAFALAAGAETDREALAHFDEAIAADPKFAAAHAARARSLAAIANQYAQGPERRAVFDDAVAAARTAVQLGPELADAQSALAFVLVSGRLDIRGARGPYERSYQLGRGDPDVVARYALFCAQTGRFPKAEAAIREAESLDPLNPRTFWNAGYIHYAARRYADARNLWRQALTLNPKMANVHAYVGYSHFIEGQLPAAQAEFQLEASALTRLPGLAIVARRQGDAATAERAFGQLVSELGDNGLYQQAQVLTQWGDIPRALATLDRALAAGDSGLFLAGQDPLLDPLRREQRFSSLLRGLGLV